MHSKIFNCFGCGQEYDSTKRIPKILPGCGHTACQICIDRTLAKSNHVKCPMDKTVSTAQGKSSAGFVTNMTLLQALMKSNNTTISPPKKSSSSSGSKKCPEHDEPLDLVCLSDGCQICKYCIDYGHHKNHEVDHIKNIQTQAKSKREYLEIMLKDFDNGQKEIDNLYNQERDALVNVIDDKFQNLIDFLLLKKQEMSSEIGQCFQLEKAKVKESLKRDVGRRKDIEAKIASLKRTTIDDAFIEALEEPLPIQARTDYEILKEQSQELQRLLADSFDAMSMSIASQINHFQQDNQGFTLLNVANNFKFEDKDGRLTILEQSAVRSVSPSPMTSLHQSVSRSRFHSRFQSPQRPRTRTVFITPKKTNNSVNGYDNGYYNGDGGKVGLELTHEALSKEKLQALARAWQQVDNVSDIKIDFHDQEITDNDLLEFFMSEFWRKSDLESLIINLQGCKVGDTSLLPLFTEILPRLTRLQSINLNLNFTKITDESLEALAQYLPLISGQLQCFQLGLYSTEVTDKSVSQLFGKMEGLATFSLELGKTKITDATIEAFVRHSLLSMKSLETFKLYLYETQVTDSGIVQLFKNMETIKTYTLELGGTKVTDYSVKTFAKNTLSTMKEVQSLQVGLYNTSVTDDGVSAMFMKMDNLKSFSLNLGNTKITDKSMGVFSMQTVPSLQEVEVFQLYLYNTEVSDQTIPYIFCEMNNAVTFLLDLDNTKVGDASIEALAQVCLPTMKYLQNFQLGLYNTKVTDQSIYQIFDGMETIKKFILDLGKTQITDRSIEAFEKNTLPTFLELEKFEFYVRSTAVSLEKKKLIAKIKAEISRNKQA